MLEYALMIGLCLILFPSSPLLVGANADETKVMVACTEPRPQVCSQDYRPVCAMLQDSSLKTYSNGCSACLDPAVTGYRGGACE